MPTDKSRPRLLFAIDKLEQSLVILRPEQRDEGLLRSKIEEVIETGYEMTYSRPSSESASAEVLGFLGRSGKTN